MRTTWLGQSVKLVGVVFASLLLNLPLDLFKNGRSKMMISSFTIIAPFVGVAVLEILRHCGRLQKFLSERSFDGLLLRMFMVGVPSFVANVLTAVSPTLFTGGLQFGMFVGLVTVAPFGTVDRPESRELRYWITFGAALAFVLGSGVYLAGGRSTAALVNASGTALFYFVGLFLGLMLGNSVNRWIEALRPTFQLLTRMGSTLIAYAVGYLVIVTFFSTLFAAVWRLTGPDSFAGLPANPTMPTFAYFSLVTATTVGYGDIVPKSGLARSVTSIESIASLAWTLVVFAALAVRFSAESVRSEPPTRDPHQ